MNTSIKLIEGALLLGDLITAPTAAGLVLGKMK
jgi:hypothetical protein